MNNCERIIELLEKNSLSDEEQGILSKLIENDVNAKEFFDTYIKLKDLFKSSGHIPDDVLVQFVVDKNENKGLNSPTCAKAPFIEKHLKECPNCNRAFHIYCNEYSSINLFLEDTLSVKGDGITPDLSPSKNKFTRKDRQKYYRLIISLLGGLIILYFVLFQAYSSFMPKYKKYASLDKTVDFYLTGERTSNEFKKSMLAIQNRDYESAIQFLKRDVQNNNEDEDIFYSYFILGITYLESAESNFLGLFPKYNKNAVESAISNLKMSISKNKSKRAKEITFDSYYLMGKGYLMLDNVSEARKYFLFVVDSNSNRAEEAKEILSYLH
ncbi:MAG: tetratricopeptide repeat protein [Clostridiales bacterium]